MKRADEILNHYSSIWSSFWHGSAVAKRWESGPVRELPASFCVLEFSPMARNLWTYATCGMSHATDEVSIELHLLSPSQTDQHVELLTAISHYHRTKMPLNFGHTVDFGRPWLPGSMCEFGLISLPYLDGPKLENLRPSEGEQLIRCLWLLSITKAERDFKIQFGMEALERKLEAANFNYADPRRLSVV